MADDWDPVTKGFALLILIGAVSFIGKCSNYVSSERKGYSELVEAIQKLETCPGAQKTDCPTFPYYSVKDTHTSLCFQKKDSDGKLQTMQFARDAEGNYARVMLSEDWGLFADVVWVNPPNISALINEASEKNAPETRRFSSYYGKTQTILKAYDKLECAP